jgi:hypothetical protein
MLGQLMSYRLWLIITHKITSLWAIWLLQNTHKLYEILMLIHIVSIEWLKIWLGKISVRGCKKYVEVYHQIALSFGNI